MIGGSGEHLYGYGELSWYTGDMLRPPEGASAWDHFVIRQSRVANMDLCQGREGLMLGQDPLPPSEAMFKGTAVHYLIDRWLDHWHADELRDWSHYKDTAPDYLRMVAKQHDGFDLDLRFSRVKAYETWVDEVVFLFHTWIEDWFLDGNNTALVEQEVGREERMFMPLGSVYVPDEKGSAIVWLAGKPDLFTADLLVDWKTSGRAWKQGKAQGLLQDDLYAALIEWTHGISIREGLYVVGDWSTNGWAEHRTRITEASIESAKRRAYAHARDLILGTWSYSPTNSFGVRHWPCKPQFCAAWDRCEAKHIGDGVGSQPIEIQGVWR